MPPSTRKYGAVVYSKPPLAPVKRSSSIGLQAIIAPTDSQITGLLSEPPHCNFSSSNRTEHSIEIPTFPSGRTSPLVVFADLRTNLLSSSQNLKNTSIDPERGARYITTSPTSPRLRTMLQEVINVHKWRENVIAPSSIPGHIPWSDPIDPPSKPWIFEGSILPAEDYASKRAQIRLQRRAEKINSEKEKSVHLPDHEIDQHSMTCVSSLATSPSYQEAMTLDREETFQTCGQPKQRSSQMSGSEMDSEILDNANVMLELHDHDVETTDVGAGVLNGRPAPPTLVLSTSTLTFPICLDSSPNLALNAPLAIRRGKELPPALTFNQNKNDMPYPSMPSAFLGSPATYSPLFEFANMAGEPSMDLDDMVASLKSRCASIGSKLLPAPRIFEEKVSRVSMASFSDEIEQDEWAFAESLMASHNNGSSSADQITLACTEYTNSEISSSVSEAEPALSGHDSAGSTSDTTPQISLRDPRSSQLRPTRPIAQNFLSLVSQPPNIPLPRKPALSPTRRVRGILKSTKSVRFAVLPYEDADRLIAVPVPPRIPPLSTTMPPIRPSFVPDVIRHEINNPASITAKSITSMVNTSVTKGLVVRSSTVRRVSESSASRPSVRASSVVPQSMISSNKDQKMTSSFLGRHSMGAKMGKENRLRSTSTPVHPSEFELEGNTVKRAQARNFEDSGYQKSRMPVAVRNIFTRFK